MPIETPSREELLSELRRVRDSCEHLPGIDDINEKSEYDIVTYSEEFGSFPAALEEAGFEIDLFTRGAGVSDQQLIDDFQSFVDDLGHRPTWQEMDEAGPHSAKRYVDRFGSWNEAVEAAGYEAYRRRIPTADLRSELRSLGDALGHPPTVEEMNGRGAYSAETYKNRFGSWRQALEAAGFDSSKQWQNVSDEEILAALRELADELGRVPTTAEMNERGAVSAVTVYHRFGSFTTAVEAAGLTPAE